MPKKYRLTRADFTALMKRRSMRIHGELVSIGVVAIKEGPKCGFVVAKKIVPRASDRNRIERLCREVLRSLLPMTQQSVAIVVYAKKPAIEASLTELQKEFTSLFARANLS